VDINMGRPFAALKWNGLVMLVWATCILSPGMTQAQGLTGIIVGTVRDGQGRALAGAQVRVDSAALIGGPLTLTTGPNGQLRFPALPPGLYVLDVALPGFSTQREPGIRIGAGESVDWSIVLTVAPFKEAVEVKARLDARDPGFGTRISREEARAIPSGRVGQADYIRAAPGISPTSPSSDTVTTVSVFGSGTNENQFLFDGTNFTCPCNGVARADPGADFIQEVHVQSVGASAEYGNMQGAVINVITRQGSNRFQFEASYYAQTATLTSQPIRLPFLGSGDVLSGYTRDRYRDAAVNLGGPVARDRLWFFAGYQHVRDNDSQPGTDPTFPRTHEQDRVFAKLTWQFAPGWQLVQSLHYEDGISPDRPTIVTPSEAIARPHVTVPAITFGNLTHTMSANTFWDVRVGRFVYSATSRAHDFPTPSRFDRVSGVTSGGPPRIGSLTIERTTAKSTFTHYRPAFLGADHQWKVGGQLERGQHHSIGVIPTGARYDDRNGVPSQEISTPASSSGGLAITASAFASDAVTIGDRLTINAGLRFDHSRAISQDLHAVDSDGRETSRIIHGIGTMYTWNVWSPRLGVTARLTADGRTILRASYGRFTQGVLTGELEAFHPGATVTRMVAYNPATQDYSGAVRTNDPKTLTFDPQMRAPHTDEYSVGVDRALGWGMTAAIAYVAKEGRDFIGWADTGTTYDVGPLPLADQRRVEVSTLISPLVDRRFFLTNPDGYSLTYDGVVIAVEKRRSHGWQALGSYTFSKTIGLLPSSGTSAAGPQTSSVSPPQPITFGRDPNDRTNARGRLPNDRPHMFRLMASADVPRTGFVVAANLRHFSGKPWTAAAQITLPQNQEQRILLEPRGSRRLSSQTLLDVRLSRPISLSGIGRIDLLLDVFNLLNDTAEESLASETMLTETVVNPAFGRPSSFIDPRRAMVSVRLNLGR
jgi:hypothetical protein